METNQNKVLPKVIMRAEFALILSGNFPKDNKDISLSVGSFRVQLPLDENSNQTTTAAFDFEATEYTCTALNNNVAYIEFTTGRGLLFDDPHLSLCFEKSIAEESDNKLSIYDLTAKYLASATEIEYFGVDPLDDDAYWDIFDIKIRSLKFSDGENEYDINPKVLESFNFNPQRIKYHV